MFYCYGDSDRQYFDRGPSIAPKPLLVIFDALPQLQCPKHPLNVPKVGLAKPRDGEGGSYLDIVDAVRAKFAAMETMEMKGGE